MRETHKPFSAWPEIIARERETVSPFLKKLQHLFEDMDRKYHEKATAYGFHCRGCAENCCLTRFYHHTFLEFFYLNEGFQALPPNEKEGIAERAAAATRAYEVMETTGQKTRTMCPLNTDDRCRLYAYRPMICRMHGIPHKLDHPFKGILTGPGCRMFEEISREKNADRFDRTPFYTSLAELEKRLRESLNLNGRVRLTVADMIVIIHGEGTL
jgi:Fe-S-cluster containining protein